MYVPQRASLLPGTPRDFLAAIYEFGAHNQNSKSSNATSALSSIFGAKSVEPDVSHHDALDVAEAWGVDRELWDRTWANLSGGEAQRIALAIAVGLGTAEVLLLDGKSPPLRAIYDAVRARLRSPHKQHELMAIPHFRAHLRAGR